VIHNISN